MSKKSRTIVFLICIFLFSLIAPLTIFYSQGYRIDLESRKITQTGGLFLKITPRQTDVYINDKFVKRTDFFFGSVLIEKLLPKRYKVEVKKEGYHPWVKNLEIKEKEVVEIKNLILFSEDINFNRLFSQVKDFWVSPDQRKLILLEGATTTNNQSWAIKLYDLNRNIKSHLISKEDFFNQEIELVNLSFSEDSREIYLETKTKEKTRYFSLEINGARPPLNQIEPPLLPAEKTVAYQKINDQIYYLDNLGYFYKSKEKLNLQPFTIKETAKYDLKIFEDFIFLQENGTLYKFNHKTKNFEYFFEKVNSLKISPDNKKIAYFSDYEIWLFFLTDKNDPPQKKSGETLFLIRLSEKINDLFWINSDYLIFQTKEKIKVTEIDERDRLNLIDIFEIKNLEKQDNDWKIFFNQSDRRIYLLSQETLYVCNPIIP